MPKIANFVLQGLEPTGTGSMEIGAEWVELGLWGLFLACFLAATVLPFSSEALLVGMALGGWDPMDLLIVASAGNTLGGMSSYGLGWLGNLGHITRWLRADPGKALVWKERIARYGVWSALLTWLPVIGDPIAIALGLVRARLWQVLVLMLIGKATRYTVILGLLV